MSSAPPPTARSRRRSRGERNAARNARIARASVAYEGTCASLGALADARTLAEPRNLGLRRTNRALAAEFVTTRPVWNQSGERIA